MRTIGRKRQFSFAPLVSAIARWHPDGPPVMLAAPSPLLRSLTHHVLLTAEEDEIVRGRSQQPLICELSCITRVIAAAL